MTWSSNVNAPSSLIWAHGDVLDLSVKYGPDPSDAPAQLWRVTDGVTAGVMFGSDGWGDSFWDYDNSPGRRLYRFTAPASLAARQYTVRVVFSISPYYDSIYPPASAVMRVVPSAVATP